jgi:hypothetical protein
MSSLAWNASPDTAVRGHTSKRNSCIAALSPGASALIAPYLRQVMLVTGAVLWEPRRPSDSIYFPVDALISVVVPMDGGEVVEACNIGSNGAAGTNLGVGESDVTTRGVVQIGGTLLQIPAARLLAAAAQNTEIGSLMRFCHDWLLMQAQQNAACNAVHPADKRLCRWLFQACERLETRTLHATQEAMAASLGVRRTTVTLMAQSLSQQGVIDYRRGKIFVADPDRLKAAACECCETSAAGTGRPRACRHSPHIHAAFRSSRGRSGPRESRPKRVHGRNREGPWSRFRCRRCCRPSRLFQSSDS